MDSAQAPGKPGGQWGDVGDSWSPTTPLMLTTRLNSCPWTRTLDTRRTYLRPAVRAKVLIRSQSPRGTPEPHQSGRSTLAGR